jgi:hypothetical protein
MIFASILSLLLSLFSPATQNNPAHANTAVIGPAGLPGCGWCRTKR